MRKYCAVTAGGDIKKEFHLVNVKEQVSDESIIETKITKSEALELLIGELAEQLRKEHQEADERVSAADRALESFKASDFLPIITDARANVHQYRYKQENTITISVEVSVKANDRRLPRALRDALMEKDEAYKIEREISRRREELNSSKQRLKNEMLRTILEATPVGQKFLRQLGEMKVRVQRSMLAPRKDA